MARTIWRPGDDGYEVREVGRWWDRKVAVVNYVADLFSRGMKNKWARRAYIELFAGPGRSWDRHRRVYVTGSAIHAMRFPFTGYVFVDIDPRATMPLEARVNREPNAGMAQVLTLDCNKAAPDVRALLPDDALALAFIDPTAWEIRLDTIADLVQGRRIDLLVTFHAIRLVRVAHLNRVDRVNAFFGTDQWLSIVREAPKYRIVEELAALYNRQLKTLGYLESFQHRVIFRSTKNSPLYQLVGFSKHERGVDFWAKAAANANESGQRPLDLGL